MASRGVGIDILEISRARKFLKAHGKSLNRFLAPSEHRLYLRSKSRLKSFALIFSAKEAVSKALKLTIHHPAAMKDFRISNTGNHLKARLVGTPKRRFPHARIKLCPIQTPGAVGILAIHLW
jgi:phosphopantetheine--protein transferase-like protein